MKNIIIKQTKKGTWVAQKELSEERMEILFNREFRTKKELINFLAGIN